MKISKFLHSCLLVEKSDGKLLFDPGKFSFVEGLVRPEEFRDISAIVLTHDHPDHLDLEVLKKIVDQNANAEVLTNSETVTKLAEAGLSAKVHEDGIRQVGGFSLKAIPAKHNAILGQEPPQNTAYLIDGVLLNPGDSFSAELYEYAGVNVLIVPVMAPWGNELQMMNFAEAMQPHTVVPVHDGHAKAFFIAQRYETFEKEFEKRSMKFANLQQAGSSFHC